MFAVRCYVFVVRSSFFVVCGLLRACWLLFDVCCCALFMCVLFVVRSVLCGVCCLLLCVVRCLFVVRCSLFVVCCYGFARCPFLLF